MLQTDVDGETIEIGDVTIEKDDGDFRPGFSVDYGPTAIAFQAREHSSYLIFQTGDGKVVYSFSDPSLFIRNALGMRGPTAAINRLSIGNRRTSGPIDVSASLRRASITLSTS